MGFFDLLLGKKPTGAAAATPAPMTASGAGTSLLSPKAATSVATPITPKADLASALTAKFLAPQKPKYQSDVIRAPTASEKAQLLIQQTADNSAQRKLQNQALSETLKELKTEQKNKEDLAEIKQASGLRKFGYEALMGLGRGVGLMMGGVDKAGDDDSLLMAEDALRRGDTDGAEKFMQLAKMGGEHDLRNPLTDAISPTIVSDELYKPGQVENFFRVLTGGAAEFVPALIGSKKAGISRGGEAIGGILAAGKSKLTKSVAKIAGEEFVETAFFTAIRSTGKPEDLPQNAAQDFISMFPSIVAAKGMQAATEPLARAGGKALLTLLDLGVQKDIKIDPDRILGFMKGAEDPEMKTVWAELPPADRMSFMEAAIGERRMLALKPKEASISAGENRLINKTGPEKSGEPSVSPDSPENKRLQDALSRQDEDPQFLPAKDKIPATPLSEARVATSSLPETSGVKPLESIVKESRTPVNEKVHLLDYLRTPSKVLEKIGLGKLSKELRTHYDTYARELPVEIQKVTDWAKRVSPEANAKIFQWLDGQKDVGLNAEELNVATEIKAYLKEWAGKMGLSEDRQISEYITHIFDRDITPQVKELKAAIKETKNPAAKAELENQLKDLQSSREFPEDLAKLIDDKVAGSVYNPFLLERKGALEYKQDTWQALDAYVKRAVRKYNMDPVLERVSKAAEKLEKSQYDYVKSYIDRVNMRPTKLDNLMDNLIKNVAGYRFGARPTATISRNVRQWIYRGTLGGNVSSAVKNLTQVTNTYSQLGEKYTLIGYTKLAKERLSGLAELREEGILNDKFIQDRTINATKKFWEKTDNGLFKLFEEAELINRGAAYYGAKAKAMAGNVKGIKKGDEAASREFAKELVRKTQFKFDSIDTPVFLGSDLAKTILQFQSYTTKQTEFIVDMLKTKDFAQIARYIGSSMVVYATVGSALNMDPIDMIFPPKRLLEEGITPPALQLPRAGAKLIMGTKDAYGRPEGVKEGINAIAALLPGGVQAKKTYQGIKALLQGGVKSSTGKSTLFKTGSSPKDILQNIIFGPYSTKEARDYFDSRDGKSALEIFTDMLNDLGADAPEEPVNPLRPTRVRRPEREGGTQRVPRAPRS